MKKKTKYIQLQKKIKKNKKITYIEYYANNDHLASTTSSVCSQKEYRKKGKHTVL